ncbi:MAG: agmatinase family protein [Crocinitomicaceae bacterium]|nr:agmatinase family protein [Crocinitomicaceae bacterium]MDP5099213.1 agmatinase family protein [Crocinitomicaceae bacterium]
MTFDPNGVGIANGNIFGFPVTEENADIVIIPIPWDATASYGKGTSDGPEAILEASTQLDFYHPKLQKAYDTQVFMTSISKEWKKINADLCIKTIDYISFLEEGGKLEGNEEYESLIAEVNETQNALKENLKERATAMMNSGKIVGVLGGEHSTPLGLIEAIDAQGHPFGILQIDAHADLRDAYEGFEQSHASIMFNALKNCKNLIRLVQVGIRDIAESEIQLIENSNERIKTFFDWDLKDGQFAGKTWQSQVNEIINDLPQNVYISFDIDGLRPELCPNTGTPVVGGFGLEEVNYLLFQLVNSGKKIVGFDLNEVAPGNDDDWDANVGARALWNMVCAVERNRRLHA